MFYSLVLSKDSNGTWLVDVPALPHVHTFGDTKAEARERARDAIVTGLDLLVDQKAPIPAPLAHAPDGDAVAVSTIVAAKIELHNAMLAQKIGKYRLGKALGWHLPQVDRLVDFRHASRLDQIEQALQVVGRRLVVTTSAA
ncbi:MAG: type II toxin-antitoxin system HicB family antitoxin [Vicinamibacterales bacterium]